MEGRIGEDWKDVMMFKDAYSTLMLTVFRLLLELFPSNPTSLVVVERGVGGPIKDQFLSC
jgi:hypothetical protein